MRACSPRAAQLGSERRSGRESEKTTTTVASAKTERANAAVFMIAARAHHRRADANRALFSESQLAPKNDLAYGIGAGRPGNRDAGVSLSSVVLKIARASKPWRTTGRQLEVPKLDRHSGVWARRHHLETTRLGHTPECAH